MNEQIKKHYCRDPLSRHFYDSKLDVIYQIGHDEQIKTEGFYFTHCPNLLNTINILTPLGNIDLVSYLFYLKNNNQHKKIFSSQINYAIMYLDHCINLNEKWHYERLNKRYEGKI